MENMAAVNIAVDRLEHLVRECCYTMEIEKLAFQRIYGRIVHRYRQPCDDNCIDNDSKLLELLDRTNRSLEKFQKHLDRKLKSRYALRTVRPKTTVHDPVSRTAT